MSENDIKKKAGRPSKKAESSSEKDLAKENKQLKAELDEIKKMLKDLNQGSPTPPAIQEKTFFVSSSEEDELDVEIRPNKYIKVMSLNFGLLVLSTEGKGQGKIFEFKKFGDVRNIVYADLANIIHNHQKFAEDGRFYIFDKNVIRNHGLVEYYDKFMTKEKIDNILTFNSKEITSLFNNTTKSQQETIVGILIKKIRNGEDIDLNKVDIISRVYGQNIYEIANEYKQEQE